MGSAIALSALLLIEECKQTVGEEARRLFRNEVAAFRHHLAAHIDRNPLQGLLRLAAASTPVRIAYRAPHRQHGHRQLEAADDGLVVSDVLRHSAVVGEARRIAPGWL